MLRFVPNSELDLQRWDHLVQQSLKPAVFSSSWYLNATCDHWDALILGDYELALALPTKIKLKHSILYQPFFTRELTVFGQREANEDELAEFRLAVLQRFTFLQFGAETNWLEEGTSEVVKHQMLPFDQPVEGLRGNYSSRAKRSIKKAVKAEYSVHHMTDPAAIVSLFQETKGHLLGELKEEDYARLKTLMERAMKADQGMALGVYDTHGTFRAGGFFITAAKSVLYLKGAVDAEGRNNGAMHFLFDYIIERFASSKEHLDFGGSKVDSVAEFFHNFGAIDREYHLLTCDRLPTVVRWAKNLKQRF